ncbi:hypothetical protein BJV74DRAFT_58893 [Russula compacta]|nr:hypothetical protein BJV74DRAFT_58893 [Russula compacta]
MSNPPNLSHFRSLFETALREYREQTGTELLDHPLTKQLETSDSVQAFTFVLQVHAQSLIELRGNDGEVMKLLKSVVDVLHSLSITASFGEGIGLPFSPAKVIFTALAIQLVAIKDVNTSASCDVFVNLLESIRTLGRLDIFTMVTPASAMTEIIVTIMLELLSALALVTKYTKLGRPMEGVKKLLGENEAVLQRLDRLTQEEAKTTARQTLEIVYGLVQNMRVVMEGGNASQSSVWGALDTMHQIVGEANMSKRDKLQQDVREWLSPPDPWINHNIARKYQCKGTGTWLIHGDTFAKWKSSGLSSLLWIHGKRWCFASLALLRFRRD